MAPGLCAGPKYGMAQATHGSAPDIAGKHVANPYAMIISAQMLLAWLGERKADAQAMRAASDIERGVDKVLANPTAVTPDLGGRASTEEMGKAVCCAIEAM